jgi:hypothetical protein
MRDSAVMISSTIPSTKYSCVELQNQLWQDVPHIPKGEYYQATAYRKDLTDLQSGAFAVFYGLRRT